MLVSKAFLYAFVRDRRLYGYNEYTLRISEGSDGSEGEQESEATCDEDTEAEDRGE